MNISDKSRPNATDSTASAAQTMRDTANKGAAQAAAAVDKATEATVEASGLVKHSFLTAAKGMQDYHVKLFEFAQANTRAMFDLVQKLSGVQSPSAFFQIIGDHAGRQLETLTVQSKELAAVASNATRATAQPLKTGMPSEFNRAA